VPLAFSPSIRQYYGPDAPSQPVTQLFVSVQLGNGKDLILEKEGRFRLHAGSFRLPRVLSVTSNKGENSRYLLFLLSSPAQRSRDLYVSFFKLPFRALRFFFTWVHPHGARHR